MKHLLTIHSLILTAIAAILTVGCGSDEYLGSDADAADVERGQTISFSSTTGKSSRASMLTGAQAAAKLHDQFVVFGTKTTGTDTRTVFDHYTLRYAANSAMTTASNSADWEYVGQNVSAASTLAPGTQQTIKYWDLSADSYDFVAFSTGNATHQAVAGTPAAPGYPGTPATGSVIVTPVNANALTTKAYTLTGQTADLAKCLVADRLTATRSATPHEGTSGRFMETVAFVFRPLAATVRLGLFETIPGYSVRNVRFYQQPISASGTATPALYAASQTIPAGKGIVNVSFPNITDPAADTYNRATVTYSPEGEKTQSLQVGTFAPNGDPQGSEKGGSVYLGRTSSTASLTTDVLVLPADAKDLTLKVDFTLVSIDYNETIEVNGATAVIPAAYTHWQPNCAYTYLFKISDKVNNAFGQALYPIRFDALETVDDDGVQQTITTVDQPSVTTYAKGTLGNDYFVGDHIYIAVTNGTPRSLSATNAKLYIAQAASNDLVTETAVAEGSSAVTLLPVPDGFMTFVDHIDALDSSSGDRVDAITGSNFAKFTAGNNIYVFEFTAAEAVLYADAAEYNAANSTSLSDSEFAALSLELRTKEPAEKHYKVIRVGDARRPLVLPEIPEEDI